MRRIPKSGLVRFQGGRSGPSKPTTQTSTRDGANDIIHDTLITANEEDVDPDYRAIPRDQYPP